MGMRSLPSRLATRGVAVCRAPIAAARHARIARATLAVLCAVLSAGVSAPGGAPAAWAQEVPENLGRFQVARLHYMGGGDWYANPSSLPNLLRELQARTGAPTTPREATVKLDDERLYAYPMLYVTGHGTIRPSPADMARLRRYLDAGGFLWVDDNYGIDKSFRAMAADLYPDEKLVPIGNDHPMYRTFYRLPGLPKIHYHDGDPAQGFAIYHEGRMALYYTWSCDIGDGLEDPEVHGDSAEKREAAMRMAINVCTFVMTQP
jgi:hypothetical protein